ncbi:hypothetical protein [Streptomyces sp. NPDC059092]|uniref:hypothetical protein n=1 Tax=Streptomyces sp. NPDC059092 TaxID=3346725 RepID=UPI0036A1B141
MLVDSPPEQCAKPTATAPRRRPAARATGPAPAAGVLAPVGVASIVVGEVTADR